jgi:PilZ domain-containing protein
MDCVHKGYDRRRSFARSSGKAKGTACAVREFDIVAGSTHLAFGKLGYIALHPLNVRNLFLRGALRYRVPTGGLMMFGRSVKPDRRRRKRQFLNTSVQVFTEYAHMDAIGINLSDVGMCLFAIADLPLGSRIQIEFLPPRNTELVRVSGIVRHRALYLYGIEFLGDSDQCSGGWADEGTNTGSPGPLIPSEQAR